MAVDRRLEAAREAVQLLQEGGRAAGAIEAALRPAFTPEPQWNPAVLPSGNWREDPLPRKVIWQAGGESGRILARGQCAVLAGAGKAGKSWLTVSLAIAAAEARREQWPEGQACGLAVVPGRALILSYEDSPKEIDLRAEAAPGPTLPATLNAWGTRSEYAYAGLINLAYAWYDPGRTAFPAGRRKGNHWLRVNDAGRYRDLSDQDRLDLFVPTAAKSVTARNALDRIKNTIRQLESAGLLRVDGRKLLPPLPGTPARGPGRRRAATKTVE